MIYQHPLAYLLGLEGVALLRAWAGDFDRDFVRRRLAEIRRLLDDETLASHEGVLVARADTVAAYRQWAASYDGPNGLFDADEPIVHAIVETLPPGDALDAACGTGRFADHLNRRGHRVVGVDNSAEMLEQARARVPAARFLLGDMHELPLADDSVDLVTCGLALSHVPDLGPVLAEFARVLRPGGNLVISNVHHETVRLGSVPIALGPGGEPGRTDAYRHTPGDFLRAALPLGLRVRRCEEPQRTDDWSTPTPPPRAEPGVGEWKQWPWSLLDLVPEATRAAFAVPAVTVWHFDLDTTP